MTDAGETSRPRPTWPLWSSVVTLLLCGVAVAWLSWCATHVVYPRVAGDRWWLAALVIPAGLGAGAMVVGAMALAESCRDPAAARSRAGWMLIATSVAALPGVVLATRWGWVAATAGDPFAGVWDSAWPLLVLLAPLVPMVPLVIARVVWPRTEPVSRRPSTARRWVLLGGTLAAVSWIWAVTGPVVTGGPAFTARPQFGFGRSPRPDVRIALADVIFEQSYAGRVLRLRYWPTSTLFWHAVVLWPESAQVELAIVEPSPGDTVEGLLGGADERPEVWTAIRGVCLDPSYDVDARLLALDQLDQFPEWQDAVVPMLLQLVRAPPLDREGLAGHIPLPDFFASTRPADALLADYRRALRTTALGCLNSIGPDPATVEPALRAAFTDPAVAADLERSLDQVLARIADAHAFRRQQASELATPPPDEE